MKTITCAEQLRQYLPNVLKEAAGERSFFTKIYPQLEEAEAWLVDEIVSEQVLDTMSEPDPLWQELCRAVSSMAIYNAVPGLDLVLTANGFGVVSNQTVAPASKSRVDALRQALLQSRDRAIAILLRKIRVEYPAWYTTPQGVKWTSCIVSMVEDYKSIPDYAGFIEYRKASLNVEQIIEQKFVSSDLMTALRQERGHVEERSFAIMRILDLIKIHNAGGNDMPSMFTSAAERLVQHLRTNEALYPEWHNSSVAELWSPTPFVNDKKASGFWF